MFYHFKDVLFADVAAAGGLYGDTPLLRVGLEELRTNMLINFETNLCEIPRAMMGLLHQLIRS